MLNCQEITTKIQEIKDKKSELDGFIESRQTELAKKLQADLQGLIDNFCNDFCIELLESKFTIDTLDIGGDTAEELQAKLEATDKNGEPKIKIPSYNQGMLNKMYESEEFKYFVQNPEQIKTIRLSVEYLGSTTRRMSTNQIYERAQEFGLELCPVEVGPYQCLKEADQPPSDGYSIAMTQILSKDGVASVFYLKRDDDRPWLSSDLAGPGRRVEPGREFMFRLGHVTPKKLFKLLNLKSN